MQRPAAMMGPFLGCRPLRFPVEPHTFMAIFS